MFKKSFSALLLAAFALLLATGSEPAFAVDRNAPSGVKTGKITPVAPRVVYVKFREGSKELELLQGSQAKGARIQSFGPSLFDAVSKQLGVRSIVLFDAHAPKDEITHSLGIDRMFCIYYSNTSIDPHLALEKLLATNEIECGSARYLFPLQKVPNDPMVSQQYALSKMSVFNAWDHTIGDTNVVIADVDCATNIDHEDLKNSIKINWGETGLDKNGHDKRTNGIDDDGDGVIDDWGGVDVVGSADRGTNAFIADGDPRPDDNSMNHGTMTAGCIAATGNNGLGVAGVAYGCKLLAIKAADNADNLSGGYEGIHWAVTHGANIVNCSWGGEVSSADIAYASTFLQEAILRNALVVAAAGNNAVSVDQYNFWPCNGPGVLSVGATTSSDQAAGFSNYGNHVCVWAPGQSIVTTTYPGAASYTSTDGTSFASPLTAGVAGLVLSQHRDWPVKFVLRQIVQTCDNVVNPGDRTEFWGRVNAQSSIEKAPVGPGIVISGYAINGVLNDSLPMGTQCDLTIKFKNVIGDGSNLNAKLLPSYGYSTGLLPTPLGSILSGAITTGLFTITRSQIFCEGQLPVYVAVWDGSGYTDTMSVMIPLKRTPGFTFNQSQTYGSSIKRLSNTSAWASFGTNQSIHISEFSRQVGGVWQAPVQPDAFVGNRAFYCIDAVDSLTAFMGTDSSGGAPASIFLTGDGGESWTSYDLHTITPFVNSIHFFDELHGIFIGDPKTRVWGIGYTDDGGGSWSPIATKVASANGEASWNNAASWVGDYGWFGTNSTRIWRTTDRGRTWKPSSTPFTHSLAIGFDDDKAHGFACFRPASTGGGATTGKAGLGFTADSGKTWTSVKMPIDTMQPLAVKFVPNSDVAYLASNFGIYRTSDFGNTWSMISIPTALTVDISDMSVSRIDSNVTVSVIAASSGIATYHEIIPVPVTQDTSAHASVGDGSSLTLELQPNSPNPFTAHTTIAFAVPVRQHVRMTVRDVAGREVRVLLDQTVEAGTQSVDLDARDLVAGVYYCTLESDGGDRLSRAMTLLK